MPSRLVIPAGAVPTDRPYAPRRTETYQEFADQAGVDGIANLGDQWCQDYGITGVGVVAPFETLAERAAREAAEQAARANRTTVETRMRQAIAANNAFIAITTPTLAQNSAHTKILCREATGLIKYVLDELTDVGGT